MVEEECVFVLEKEKTTYKGVCLLKCIYLPSEFACEPKLNLFL